MAKTKAPVKTDTKAASKPSGKPSRRGLVIAAVATLVLGVGGFAFKAKSSNTKPESAHGEAPTASSTPGAPTASATSAEHESENAVVAKLRMTFQQMQSQARRLQRTDEDNHELRNENADLRIRIEKLKLECSSQVAQARTKKVSDTLGQETGTEIGRTLETIDYRAPTQLLPAQLHVLAITYFKAKDYERAAVLLTHLLTQEATKEYRNARNYLLAGVSWYRLDHVKHADYYFGKTLEEAGEAENLKFHAQARLWRAIVAKGTGKATEAQTWLTELVDYHPNSKETAWVNGKKPQAKREVASEPATQVPAKDEGHTNVNENH